MRGQGRWPAIDAWFNAMETRETYLGIKSDIYTHVFDLPPQIGGAHCPCAYAVVLNTAKGCCAASMPSLSC